MSGLRSAALIFYQTPKSRILRRLLTALVLVFPAISLAGDASDAPEPKKKVLATSLLPDGSELKGVMLPRYDENHQLAGVLKAKAMTLVGAGQVAGKTVTVEFFNPDHSLRGRIDLVEATFYQEKELLIAKETVKIKSDRMTATGTGLYYSLKRGEGFLLGPATTTILQAPVKTSMNAPTSPLRATALLGMSLLTQSLLAVPPPALTSEDIAAMRADAVTKAPAVATENKAAQASVEIDLADAATASKSAAAFLAQADLPPVPPDAAPVDAKPLDIQPGPDDTVIHCEGGMYFDADEGVLVYLKNVTVNDPRFNLTGANELKVFFGKKPVKPEPKDKPKAPPAPDKDTTGFGGKIGANFGDVERIVATGAVRIDQKAVDGKPPIKASGAIFTYNVKADQIILSGGYPWFTQGTTFMRAKQPNLILRISPKTGSFITEGNWDMGGNLEQKK